MKEIRYSFEYDSELEHIDVQVRASERDAQVEALLERISGAPPNLLTLADADGALRKVAADDIISVTVSGKLVRFITAEGVYTLKRRLQNVESELDGDTFLRVSRHELVNINKIKKYDFTLAGTLRLELAGGIETWVSRRCLPAIRRRLDGEGEKP